MHQHWRKKFSAPLRDQLTSVMLAIVTPSVKNCNTSMGSATINLRLERMHANVITNAEEMTEFSFPCFQ